MRLYKPIAFIFSISLLACVKDKPQVVAEETPSLTAKRKVFVVNEGNFGTGNASLSYYNPLDNTVLEDYYKTQNNSSIGDVLQSLCFFNGKYYLVVNNSNKILICDSNFKKVNQITGLNSPRYILPVSNDKAYVSDLYANQIHVINLNTNTKTASIPCPGWTEQMQVYNGKLFVTNFNKDYLYVVNVLNDAKVDSISLGPNASSLVKDKNNRLWILCGGDKSKSRLPQLITVDATNNQIAGRWNFGIDDEPGHLCLNKTGDTLYFLNKGIYRMSVTQSSLPSSSFIEQGARNFYGLGIDPFTCNIYVSDALDYIQRSNCYIYNSKGQQLNLFKSGINANAFYFE